MQKQEETGGGSVNGAVKAKIKQQRNKLRKSFNDATNNDPLDDS